jgi:hypothetical protein
MAERARIATLPTGRLVLVVPTRITRCRLRRPRVDLPWIADIGNLERLFELPIPDSRNIQYDIDLLDEAQSSVDSATVAIEPGPSRPERRVEEDAVVDRPWNAIEAVDRLLSFHVERCNEILFPSRVRGAGRPRRIQTLTRADWQDARKVYWQEEDEDGPLRLIVRIAEECTHLLQAVCDQPRRMLRRVRERVRLDRVQQMDDGCIRWFVRQLGRTILEKAGPQRRVMSVQRVETADTLENRIVRDFMERSVRECTSYVREHRRHNRSQRVRAVTRFRTRLLDWLRRSELGFVPRPVGNPPPNYVLQFDERYAPLWYWYDRLRRQQMGTEEAWRWRNRVFAEHCRMALAETMSTQEYSPEFLKRLYLRMDHDRGYFFDSASLLSLWNVSEWRPTVASAILGSADYRNAMEDFTPDWVVTTGADFLIIRWHLHTKHRVPIYLLVYCMLVHDEYEIDRVLRAATEIGRDLDAARVDPHAAVLVMTAFEQPESGVATVSTCNLSSGRSVSTASMPMPPTARSWDVTEVLQHSGILDE